VIEHDPLDRVQVTGEKLSPVVFELQVTLPPGVVGVPPSVSATAAVQVVDPLSPTGLGVQLTLTALIRFATFSANVPELDR